MKTFVLAATAALAALTMTPAANAATTIVLTGSPLSGSFGNTVAGSFSDVYEFTLSNPGYASGSVTSISFAGLGAAGDISFDSISINDTFFFTPMSSGVNEWHLLTPAVLLSGATHTLKLVGTAIGTGSYGGQLNVAAVPEPATWAMMVVGIAAVGMTMRRRSQNMQVAFS